MARDWKRRFDMSERIQSGEAWLQGRKITSGFGKNESSHSRGRLCHTILLEFSLMVFLILLEIVGISFSNFPSVWETHARVAPAPSPVAFAFLYTTEKFSHSWGRLRHTCMACLEHD